MLNRQIEEAFTQLQQLKSNTSIQFPSKVAYAIVRNLRVFEPICIDIITTKRQVLERNSRFDEESNSYIFETKEARDAVQKELDELDNTETKVNVHYIKFSDIEPLSLSIDDMDALYFMIDEE